MAQNGEAIVSLENLKTNLRITHNEHDDLLSSLRDAAIGNVEAWTGLPLIERERAFITESPPPGDNPSAASPLLVAVGLKSIESISYWETNQRSYEAPTGAIAKAKINHQPHWQCKYTYVLSVTDGWPSMLDGSVLLVNCKVNTEQIPDDLKHAIIIIVRDLYNGRHMEHNLSAGCLISPHQVYVSENLVVSVPK